MSLSKSIFIDFDFHIHRVKDQIKDRHAADHSEILGDQTDQQLNENAVSLADTKERNKSESQCASNSNIGILYIIIH